MTTRASRRTQKIVLVFGESINDARSIEYLIRALCPSLEGRIKARPSPISLNKAASKPKVKSWMDQLRDIIENYEQPVGCVFVHRDADRTDSEGDDEQGLQKILDDAGIDEAHAVVPVEEIEAWWLLFATATEKFRKSWSGTLKTQAGNVDMISNPKSELRKRTGSKNQKTAYVEANSPKIAMKVAEAIRAGIKPSGQSSSYNRFVSSVEACCDRILNL